MIKTPIIDIKNPSILSPAVASFWSPKPNIFFEIPLASYINITPITDKTSPKIKNIVSYIITSNILFQKQYLTIFSFKNQAIFN